MVVLLPKPDFKIAHSSLFLDAQCLPDRFSLDFYYCLQPNWKERKKKSLRVFDIGAFELTPYGGLESSMEGDFHWIQDHLTSLSTGLTGILPLVDCRRVSGEIFLC